MTYQNINTHSQHLVHVNAAVTVQQNSPLPVVVQLREVHVFWHPTACDVIMQSAASMTRKPSAVCGATVSQATIPTVYSQYQSGVTSMSLAFPNHVLPTSCLLCCATQYRVLHGQRPFHTHRVPLFFKLAHCSKSICRSVGNGTVLRLQERRLKGGVRPLGFRV